MIKEWEEVLADLKNIDYDYAYDKEELFEEIKDCFLGFTFRGEDEVIIKFIERKKDTHGYYGVIENYIYHAYTNHEYAPIAVLEIEKRADFNEEYYYGIESVETTTPYIDWRAEQEKVRDFDEIKVKYNEEEYFGNNLEELIFEIRNQILAFDDDMFEEDGILEIAQNGDITIKVTGDELVKYLYLNDYLQVIFYYWYEFLYQKIQIYSFHF